MCLVVPDVVLGGPDLRPPAARMGAGGSCELLVEPHRLRRPSTGVSLVVGRAGRVSFEEVLPVSDGCWMPITRSAPVADVRVSSARVDGVPVAVVVGHRVARPAVVSADRVAAAPCARGEAVADVSAVPVRVRRDVRVDVGVPVGGRAGRLPWVEAPYRWRVRGGGPNIDVVVAAVRGSGGET